MRDRLERRLENSEAAMRASEQARRLSIGGASVPDSAILDHRAGADRRLSVGQMSAITDSNNERPVAGGRRRSSVGSIGDVEWDGSALKGRRRSSVGSIGSLDDFDAAFSRERRISNMGDIDIEDSAEIGRRRSVSWGPGSYSWSESGGMRDASFLKKSTRPKEDGDGPVAAAAAGVSVFTAANVTMGRIAE